MKKNLSKSASKKQLTSFSPRIRSRHSTHDGLRGKLGYFKKRCVIRFGSTTPTEVIFPKGVDGNVIEINSVTAIKNSANKRRMKTCFTKAGVQTAPWFIYTGGKWQNITSVNNEGKLQFGDRIMEFPVISKHIYGSRGTGNRFHNTAAELESWRKGKTEKEIQNYIVEEYFSGVREYRLHITKAGCFYGIRKMLKRETSKDDRWQRHDDNSVWIIESNPNFDKPVNWNRIVEDCVNALKACEMDFGAFDIRVQSTLNKKGEKRTDPRWCIIEVNSAPSFGQITLEKYIGVLPSLIRDKML